MTTAQIPFDIEMPELVWLRTKNLSCGYHNGNLHFIKAANDPLICVVYCAVRDTNWGTIPVRLTHENIQQSADSFIVTCSAQFEQNDISFEASYRITGTTDDSILFEMTGVARSDFFSNRIGLCVHLPTDCNAALPLTVTAANGDETRERFPANIGPYPLFSPIQQMRWQTAGGGQIQLLFEGEVFEAEDQRNWMDYSYKIYSRPLRLPFPFIVEAGDSIQQKLLMHFSNRSATFVKAKKQIGDRSYVPVPAIGLAAAAEPVLLSVTEIKLLHHLPLAQYRAELDFETDWKAVLAIHLRNVTSLDTSLELVLFFSDHYVMETAAFVQAIGACAQRIKSILPLHKKYPVTPGYLQAYFYPRVRQHFPQIKIGYGTDAYFAELNRCLPHHLSFDFFSFSINPQVHLSDAHTVLENLGSIPDMLATLQSFTDKPVHVSPVTFKKRKNHDAATGNRHAHIDPADKRQHTWFGAGWFLRCLYASRNAAQVTFFTTTGAGGVVNDFLTTSPLYDVLQQLKLFSPVAMKKDQHSIVFTNHRSETMQFVLDERFFPFG